MKTALCALAVIVLLCLPVRIWAQDDATEKILITSETELPRYSYGVDALASELFHSEAAMAELIGRVENDLRTQLETYDIRDRKALREIESVLAHIAMLKGNYPEATERLERVRDLEETPSLRAASGVLYLSWIDARQAVERDDIPMKSALAEALEKRLEKLPAEIVLDELENTRCGLKLYSEDLIVDVIRASVDPGVAEQGNLKCETANMLIHCRTLLTCIIAHRDIILAVLTDFINAHQFGKGGYLGYESGGAARL